MLIFVPFAKFMNTESDQLYYFVNEKKIFLLVYRFKLNEKPSSTSVSLF